MSESPISLGYAVAAVDSFKNNDLSGLFAIHDVIAAKQFTQSSKLLTRLITYTLPENLCDDPSVQGIVLNTWKESLPSAVISAGVLLSVHDDLIRSRYGGEAGDFNSFDYFMNSLVPSLAAVDSFAAHGPMFVPMEGEFNAMRFLRDTAAFSVAMNMDS